MYDAFISYSRLDAASVQSLKQQLEARHFRVFLDLDSLRAGQDWPPALGDAVQNSRVMILCWSAHAAISDWVRAEINHSLSTRKPVPIVPWLLDGTPLPDLLRQRHGIQGDDPGALVKVVADQRRRHRMRRLSAQAAAVALLVPAVWLSPRLLVPQSLAFHGHVFDEEGKPVPGATVEAVGRRAQTDSGGDFLLTLPKSTPGGLQVTVRKTGYATRHIETQSDVPDLGVRIEKER